MEEYTLEDAEAFLAEHDIEGFDPFLEALEDVLWDVADEQKLTAAVAKWRAWVLSSQAESSLTTFDAWEREEFEADNGPLDQGYVYGGDDDRLPRPWFGDLDEAIIASGRTVTRDEYYA